jgi:hypothetical protein
MKIKTFTSILFLSFLFSNAFADSIAESSIGRAIIIAASGAHQQNTLFPYTEEMTRRMYRLLKERGYTDNDIVYLNPKTWQDLDGDGVDDKVVDDALFDSIAALESAFDSATHLQAGQQFVFYLHGHGLPNQLKITRDYWLPASELRRLVYKVPLDVSQVIILDTGYSGSFFDELKGVENRILISSTDDQAMAWNVRSSGFSDSFLDNLRRGDTLWDAFQSAERMIISDPSLFGDQRPWLDDDGDGLYISSRDGELAKTVFIGKEPEANNISNQAPTAIFTVSPTNGDAPLTVTLDASSSTDSDGTIVLYKWSASDGQTASGKRVNMTFPNAGTYTISLVVTDDQVAQSTNTAQQTVTVDKPVPPVIVEPPNPDSLGQAIIIAAGGAQPNNTLFDYSNDFTQRMYRLLKERGFTDADVHYMNPWQPDIDLDGYPDDNRQDYNLFDPEPELSAAFAQAAANLSAGQQFVFYLHGHARKDHFLITPSYELSASRLRDLLATLPDGVQQVIILDSCYSGSFADELAGVENRVVITSADESTLAWNTQFTSFADKFLRSLRHGETLRQAFFDAEDMILGDSKLFREQRPWLDDDGDGQYTSRDGTRAASIYLGQEGVHAAPPPKITLAHDRLELIDNATSATLWVRTTPKQDGIRRVQAVLINPNFAGSDYQGEATDFGREEVALIYNPAQDRHEIAYDGFWTAGNWRILYQAQNTEGVWSDIVSGEVQVSNIGCNPCVKMVLNQSRYTANEQLRLDMEINGNAELDLYVVILFPESIFITITYPLNFSFPNAIQAYQTGVTITGEKRYPVIDFPLPLNVGLGRYQPCGVLTGTGNDPKNINDWLHWHCADFEVY